MFGLLPPTAGCAWHAEHWLRLKRGPRPTGPVPETFSTCSNRVWPLSKNSVAPGVVDKSGRGPPALIPVLIRTPGSVWASAGPIIIDPATHIDAYFRILSRILVG